MTENAIVSTQQFNPMQSAALARTMKEIVKYMLDDKILVQGVDYGVIPGTNKPTLLKPGAERLIAAHQLHNTFVPLTVVEGWERGFFFYRYECRLTNRETGELYGTGVGSCNSMETKYRWRWVDEAQLPAGLDASMLERKDARKTLSEFDFAIKKKATAGKYGKPLAYWQQFEDAIANGTAVQTTRQTQHGESVAYEITQGTVLYRVPNNEPFDLVNTIDKMAQKRALIAAALIATNASEFFTQDLEDFAMPVVTIESVSDALPAPAQPSNVIDMPQQASNGQSKPAASPLQPKFNWRNAAWWADAVNMLKDEFQYTGKNASDILHVWANDGQLNETMSTDAVLKVIRDNADIPF